MHCLTDRPMNTTSLSVLTCNIAEEIELSNRPEVRWTLPDTDTDEINKLRRGKHLARGQEQTFSEY